MALVDAFVLYFPAGFIAIVWESTRVQILWLVYQVYAVLAMHVVRILGWEGCGRTEERVAQLLKQRKKVCLESVEYIPEPQTDENGASRCMRYEKVVNIVTATLKTSVERNTYDGRAHVQDIISRHKQSQFADQGRAAENPDPTKPRTRLVPSCPAQDKTTIQAIAPLKQTPATASTSSGGQASRPAPPGTGNSTITPESVSLEGHKVIETRTLHDVLQTGTDAGFPDDHKPIVGTAVAKDLEPIANHEHDHETTAATAAAENSEPVANPDAKPKPATDPTESIAQAPRDVQAIPAESQRQHTTDSEKNAPDS
jgi:hypothetical protein